MDTNLREEFNRLLAEIETLPEVKAIGKSGGGELTHAADGDIDLFVFCDSVPSEMMRRQKIEALGSRASGFRIGKHPGKHWGTCDFVYLSDAEICLMYYTAPQMNLEIDAILTGARPDKEDNYFYPTGRCASFLSMYVLYDPCGYIVSVQQRLREYPAALAETLASHHLEMLNDAEDMERAAARRDPLFYHFALDLSLDHFLQALFAMNRCYFPSRKRSAQWIASFAKKPERCAERLLEVIELGARAETVPQSYQMWQSLCSELAALL